MADIFTINSDKQAVRDLLPDDLNNQITYLDEGSQLLTPFGHPTRIKFNGYGLCGRREECTTGGRGWRYPVIIRITTTKEEAYQWCLDVMQMEHSESLVKAEQE